jgi:hypothetical protein
MWKSADRSITATMPEVGNSLHCNRQKRGSVGNERHVDEQNAAKVGRAPKWPTERPLWKSGKPIVHNCS